LIKAHYRQSAYYFRLKKINPNTDDVIPLKFDTGAVNTVISLNTLLANKGIDVESDEAKLLKENFRTSLRPDISKKIFYSASGNDMIGFLCHSKNVKLSGYEVKNFYYYMVYNIDKQIALLGDDFISCCHFNHESNSDIVITYFNSTLYESKCKRTSLDTDEVFEIFDKINIQI